MILALDLYRRLHQAARFPDVNEVARMGFVVWNLNTLAEIPASGSVSQVDALGQVPIHSLFLLFGCSISVVDAIPLLLADPEELLEIGDIDFIWSPLHDHPLELLLCDSALSWFEVTCIVAEASQVGVELHRVEGTRLGAGVICGQGAAECNFAFGGSLSLHDTALVSI